MRKDKRGNNELCVPLTQDLPDVKKNLLLSLLL